MFVVTVVVDKGELAEWVSLSSIPRPRHLLGLSDVVAADEVGKRWYQISVSSKTNTEGNFLMLPTDYPRLFRI